VEAGPDGAAPDTSTVYRTLELLERLGLVWHTHLGKGAPVYHAAEHLHLHVVCATCGEISSVDPALLDPAAERLAADLGFQLDVGHVALSGTCRACRERAGSES
jgi:Fur family ferric uptake transcriptional regulator